MRVLLVSPLPPPVGGIASWTENYLKFGNSGFLIQHVDSSMRGKRAKGGKINLLTEVFRFLQLNNDIKHLKRKYKTEVIHYNASCSTAGLIRDYLTLMCCHVPIIYQCHCNLYTNVCNNISRLFFKLICKKVSIVCVLNEDSARLARQYSRNVEKIPNFIQDMDICQHTYREQIEKVCFVGRATISKGIVEYIETAKRNKDIFFFVIGPFNTNEYINPLPENLICLGQKNHEEVMGLLKDMDVYILPSYSEGFPVGVLEAMSLGIPVIATRVGAIPEMIENKGGVLVSVKSVEEISQALEEINLIEVRKKMGKFNQQKVAAEYTDTVVMEKFRKLYERVIVDGTR